MASPIRFLPILLLGACPLLPAADLDAVFNAAQDIPLTADGFTASGKTLAITLNHAPPAGTNLTVIRNTSADFIGGTFSNLAQGQRLDLNFGGQVHAFCANYFGGTGNDLVLQWANTRLVSWGYNRQGQLGHEDKGATASPITTPAAAASSAIYGKTVFVAHASEDVSLVACSDGSLFSWGRSQLLGLNLTTYKEGLPYPVDTTGVLNGKTIIGISGGRNHVAVLAADGTVASWGSNFYGELGNNTTASHPSIITQLPVALVSSPAVTGKRLVAISCGVFHTTALCSDGTVVSWGRNLFGALGTNSSDSSYSSSVPVAVVRNGVLAGKTVIAISTGRAHTLALCSDNTLVAWGSNTSGELGNNSTIDSPVPVLANRSGLLAGKTITAIAAGGDHSMALCSDGTLASWGSNYSGQLGINSTTVQRNVPVAVVKTGVLSGKTITGISAGEEHSSANCSDGTVATWGANTNGQLGNSAVITESRIPVAVTTSPLGAGERYLQTFSGSLSKSILELVATAAPVTATTGDATLVNDFAATLNATVGGGATVSFEYGPTTAYGSSISGTPPTVSSSTAQPVGARITGLLPGTIYHYRVIASAPLGIIRGADMTFTTTTRSALVSLEPGQGQLTPLFSPVVSTYDVSVPFSSAALHVTATPVAAGATLEVNGNAAPAGAPGTQIPLAVGNNTITIEVTSPDGQSIRNYTLSVLRFPEVVVFGGTSLPAATVKGFHAAGDAPGIRLDFPPAPGTLLTLIQTTGLAPLGGQFTNLSHGQIIGLAYGESIYKFVANYHGGDGNDLVLQWANMRLTGWGNNTDGQLGNGTFNSVLLPQPVATSGVLVGKSILNCQSTFSSARALAFDGKLAAWGTSDAGEFGTGVNALKSAIPIASGNSGPLAAKIITAVAAGHNFTVVLCSDGSLFSWGGNEYGQLGDGTVITRNRPVAVNTAGLLAGKRVIAIAAGIYHTMVLCSDGTLATWGFNSYGQLGDGSMVNRTAAVLVNRSNVLATRSVVKIAAGGHQCFALCSDGAIACWGRSDFGQLGTGFTGDFPTPQLVRQTGVLAGKTIVRMLGSINHSLVLCSDGSMAAWGYNPSGQLGDGSSTTRNVPVAVTASGALSGKTVTDIALGRDHSVALCSDGTLVTWGENSDGQLGTGNTTSSRVPVAVNRSALDPQERVCAVFAGPNARNSHALLAVPLPIAVTDAANDISATTAILRGTAGGNGSSAAISFEYGPTIAYGTIVPAAPANAAPSGTSSFSAALSGLQPGTTYHFRIAAESASGNTAGTGMTFTTPSDNAKLASLDLDGAPLLPAFSPDRQDYHATLPFNTATSTITATPEHPGAAVTINGELGNTAAVAFPVGQTTVPVIVTAEDTVTRRNLSITVTRLPASFTYETGEEAPVSVPGIVIPSVPASFTLNHIPLPGSRFTVIDNTGTGFIQGHFSNLPQGQLVTLSHGDHSYQFVADYFGGTGNDLVLHWAHNAAFAWGANRYGQLGSDTGKMPSSLPVPVDATGVLKGKTLFAVSAGYLHGLALCSDGTLASWGYNIYGQLGDGTTVSRTLPVSVSSSGALAGKTVVAITSGPFHNLALCSDGSALAWGYNNHGQLGDGTKATSPVPVAVAMTGSLTGKTIVALAAGAYQSFALASDGSVAAWGYNDEGELGDGTTISTVTPVAVKGALTGRTVQAISAGHYHALALCTDGTVASWGYNHRGQLGNGSSQPSAVPIGIHQSGILAGKSVTTIRAGGDHGLALCSDGIVAAWGSNDSGQLGDGSTTLRLSPVAIDQNGVLAGKRVVSLNAGSGHSLALCADGTLAAWGSNLDGRLGSGSTTPMRQTPVVVGLPQSDARYVSGPGGAAAAQGLAIAALTSPGAATVASNAIGIPTIEAWRLLHFGDDAGLEEAADFGDPDGDGIVNLIEYAFGLNPAAADATALPRWQADGKFFTLEFTEPNGLAGAGVHYAASFTLDLEKDTWHPVPDEGNAPMHRFRIPMDQPRKFMRLEVHRP